MLMTSRAAIRLAVGVGLLAGALASEAQETGKVVRVGRLVPTSRGAMPGSDAALRQGLRDLGWIEGQNIVFEYRSADGDPARLPRLAAELVRLKVHIIVAGSTPGVQAAKAATATIPIVMVTSGDPVANGLVTSLARPGGNVTGLTALGQELSAKQLEILREAVPGVARVAVLANPAHPETKPSVKSLETAAGALGIQLRVVEARGPAELEKAFATMTGERCGALMVLADITLNANRQQVVALAAKNRLPAIYALREYVEDGGLMFYGASLPGMYQQAAVFVDKILKGMKPADLPIQQPTKFELVINGRTAKALGITLAPALLLRADRVLEP